jgi:hypothetical protein
MLQRKSLDAWYPFLIVRLQLIAHTKNPAKPSGEIIKQTLKRTVLSSVTD